MKWPTIPCTLGCIYQYWLFVKSSANYWPFLMDTPKCVSLPKHSAWTRTGNPYVLQQFCISLDLLFFISKLDHYCFELRMRLWNSWHRAEVSSLNNCASASRLKVYLFGRQNAWVLQLSTTGEELSVSVAYTTVWWIWGKPLSTDTCCS
jgi:hypothetical protein